MMGGFSLWLCGSYVTGMYVSLWLCVASCGCVKDCVYDPMCGCLCDSVCVRVWHCEWDYITWWFYVVFSFWLCAILCCVYVSESLHMWGCGGVRFYVGLCIMVFVCMCVWLCAWYSTCVRLWEGIESRSQGGWLYDVSCVTACMKLHLCDYVSVRTRLSPHTAGAVWNSATCTLFFSFYFNCYLKNFHSKGANFPFHYDIFWTGRNSIYSLRLQIST